MENDPQRSPHECHLNWVHEQEQDLEELLSDLNREHQDEHALRFLITKSMQHYQNYTEVRAGLARQDSTPLFSPTWTSSFQNSYLWIAGCRPSLAIRLLYALSGSELELQLSAYLNGERCGTLSELSARQQSLMSELRCRTVREEDKLSSKMAHLEEEVRDQPLARERGGRGSEVDRVLEGHTVGLAGIMEDADKLRVSTLRSVVDILTPLQAVDFLTAAKQLHLSVHEWGQTRDRQRGRR